MGRHSAGQALQPDIPQIVLLQAAATRVSTQRSRREERALARARAKRRTLRRYSAIPIGAALLATCFSDDTGRLFGHPAGATAAGSVDAAQVGTTPLFAQPVDLNRSITVSRDRRPAAVSADGVANQLVAPRPPAPATDPLKTVAGTWFRPSTGAMSSCFCMRWGSLHEGIDLAGPMGSPIVAAGDGIVLDAGPAAGFGNWIVIQHSNGDVTIYGHMFVVLVSNGQHVTAGEHIANIGDDGEATGPHLHFGVRKGGINGPYLDPVPWLRARGIVIGAWDPNA